MALSDILNAPQDYDNDLQVVFSYNGTDHVPGFQYGIFNQILHWTFLDENKGLSALDINKLLIERRYRPLNKRTDETPFAPCWDYRQKAPIWPVFRGWLYTYYDDKHYRAIQNMADFAGDRSSVIREFYERAARQEEAYASIIIQLYDVRPNFETMCQWVTSQEHIYASHRNQQITSTYKHFSDILAAYHEMMERVQREKKREGE